jgi:thiol-disulfide isomerase/thioredoxin
MSSNPNQTAGPELPVVPVATGQRRRVLVVVVAIATFVLPIAAVVFAAGQKTEQSKPPEEKEPAPMAKREAAPEFPAKLDWINTAGPLSMKDLKGKVVILDFWTLCCINCIHILPDLAKLEKKYANELVVIGVHSAKFENEKDTKSIRKAVLRYEIAHPVVNDADHLIWNAYNVSSWPTFVVIDTEGRILGETSGEGNYEVLDRVVGKLVEEGKANKTLNEKPLRFDLVRFREKGDTPLFFPGKVVADETRKELYITDSTHHRVVITDLDGTKKAIVGTGSPGWKDGGFAEAQFDDPQGMTRLGDVLYVADRKNHVIRAIDLKTQKVSTVAGTGKQASDFTLRLQTEPSDATKTPLNSPWDLLAVGNMIYIAMAGHHQIWKWDTIKKTVVPFSGDGRENIKDGPHYAARFAQPSGLAADKNYLYVADSEVSAIRKVPLDPEGRVSTLVGTGLFDFGDVDGTGEAAKIQHALGVALYQDKLIVADTYNSKLKSLDPTSGTIKTLPLKPADPADKDPLFNEPSGLTIVGDRAYVTDTNAHRIRVVDLKAGTVSTLPLKGVDAPPPQKDWLPPQGK